MTPEERMEELCHGTSRFSEPPRTLRPRHVGHVLEWLRSLASVAQVTATTILLLRAFHVL